MGSMKANYKVLTSRELKILFKRITDQYGNLPELFKKHAFIQGKEKTLKNYAWEALVKEKIRVYERVL